MVNKTPVIMEHIKDRDPGIIFLTETWLKSEKSDITALIKTYGYILLHNRRKNRTKEIGGGVGIMLKSNYLYKHLKFKQFSSFEMTILKVSLQRNKYILLVCIYRVLFIAASIFLEEIVQLFESLVTMSSPIVLAGDVNIHMDDDKSYSLHFKEILETFNFVQHVNFATHKQGHTLDIVATLDDSLGVSNLIATEYDVSSHFLLDFNLSIVPETKKLKSISYRATKNINSDKLIEDINSKVNVSENLSFKDNIDNYNSTLRQIIDQHAPIKRRIIKEVNSAPWFDSEYKEIRRKRRNAEKSFRNTGLAVHKECYVKLRKQAITLAHKKKCQYYENKLCRGNIRLMYTAINTFLDKTQERKLPTASSDEELANTMMKFFNDKIENIRSSFKESDIEIIKMPNSNGTLLDFGSVTEDEVTEIISSHGIKCSPDDPVPLNLVKDHLNLFVPIWTKLINLSLSEGSIEGLKNAVVLPLIKEINDTVDVDTLKNYRPVSNLLLVEKLIERIVHVKLEKHMNSNNLNSDFQYGYKKGHSTETLLVKVVNDLMLSCDKNIPTLVMLLDLSAAFDTVDQEKLLKILQYEIGIGGTALKWFRSFLKGRTQKVKINSSYSFESLLKYGVAQGSVLGAILFNIYIRSIYKYLDPLKMSIFGFADDHQLLKTFLPFLQVQALGEDIQDCFNRIANWMNNFFLKLNTDKTKFLVIMPPSLAKEIHISGTFIDGKCIRFVHSAKNLGIILDQELSFQVHIQKVVKSCFHIIRNLSRIKDFLTYEQLRTAVSGYILSKLDYCNALYFGVNAVLLNMMQYVQNSAARLLRKKGNFPQLDTSACFKKLHWLQVRERIIFKICLLVHKSLMGIAPNSLSKLFTYSTSDRTMKLKHLPYYTKFGMRSISRIGPKAWNILPLTLRMERCTTKFKANLKTFLFDSDILTKL